MCVMGFRYGGIDRQVNTYFEDISGQFIMYQGALNYGKMALLSAKNVEMNACTFYRTLPNLYIYLLVYLSAIASQENTACITYHPIHSEERKR